MSESHFNKVAGLRVATLLKQEAPTWLFSCEYCKIFKNSFLYGTPAVAASENGRGI